jgi:hypothetical protein
MRKDTTNGKDSGVGATTPIGRNNDPLIVKTSTFWKTHTSAVEPSGALYGCLSLSVMSL